MSKKRIKPRARKKQIKKSKQPQKSVGKTNYSTLIGLAIMILLGIIIYSNTFDGTFHIDDKTKIMDNVKIRDVSDIKTIWSLGKTRFIPYYTLAVNYHFGQLDVWGYHFVNLLIHLITACLVFWLSFLIFSSPVLKDNPIARHKKTIALFTALLFVSHPLATQSVAYLIQRMASIVTLFYLLSLALYIKARLSNLKSKSQYLLFAGAAIAAICAFLSKQNAFTLPFAIVLAELCFFQTKKPSFNFKDYRTYVPIIALLGFVLILAFNFSFKIFEPEGPSLQNDFRTITSSHYLLTQFSVIAKYIQLLILPIGQNVDYDWALSTSFFELRTLLSFLFLLSLLALGGFLFKKHRLISFGIFWFFLTLSIESSIIPISDLIFEHRTYLPSFGFFLILSYTIYTLLWHKNKNLALGILVIIIGVNSLLTYERNKIWKTEYSLWNDIVSKSPNKARGYMQRGISLASLGKWNEAIQDYNKALEMQPFHKTYNNRGNAYKALNRLDEAVRDYQKALEIKPDYALPHNNIAAIYMPQKRYQEAIVELNKAIEKDPRFAQSYVNRGVTYLNLGNREKGCIDLNKAVELGFGPANNLYQQYCK